MDRKIAFFDLDGTLSSEIDGSIPESAIQAIREARANGHLMFINTGRCLQTVEQRFRDIGFDGYICGCGTNVFCDGKEILHKTVSHEIVLELLQAAREFDVEILFEGKDLLSFDLTRPLRHPGAIQLYESYIRLNYKMADAPESPEFHCDKFVIWYERPEQLEAFRKVSDKWFYCIDRGGTFRELVPLSCTKATGIQLVLDYYSLPKEAAYALGDSNNDLPMLSYLENSIAMGNALPQSLFNQVSYVTTKASEDGILNALKHFHFI